MTPAEIIARMRELGAGDGREILGVDLRDAGLVGTATGGYQVLMLAEAEHLVERTARGWKLPVEATP